MNHADDDTIWAGDPVGWARPVPEAALEPLPEPEPQTVTPFPALNRPAQVVKAIATLAGNVDVWTEDGELPNLDSYLARRIDGEPHPLAWRKQYMPYDAVVKKCAKMLRAGA